MVIDISNPTEQAIKSLRVLSCTIYPNQKTVVERSVYCDYFINTHLISKQAYMF